jgi:hypothetical protein
MRRARRRAFLVLENGVVFHIPIHPGQLPHFLLLPFLLLVQRNIGHRTGIDRASGADEDQQAGTKNRFQDAFSLTGGRFSCPPSFQFYHGYAGENLAEGFMQFSRTAALLLAGSLFLLMSGFLSGLSAAPVKKKRQTPKDPSKTAAPVVTEKPKRNQKFDFETATEGKVEDFAQGETLAQRQEHFHAAMIKKYNKDGSGHLSPDEETRMLQDFNAKQMLIIQRYDWKEHDELSEERIKYMENVLYQKRLEFMKSFDLEKNGYLNPAETKTMRAELQKRRENFVDTFDR